jgi:ABC-type polysaccharide/polyol phosphate transport system ATPase subunit
MSEPGLSFDHVWKRFRRGGTHDTLRDLLPAMARRLTGREPRVHHENRDFWALQDLSFSVRPGEVLGIIGSNGAGKSTTLKILNRVMEPTSGVVRTTGKVGALIEVSAGFHQDLTGRQNIFLQGAIMGMRKAEVQRKFDEIVEFSGVADFLDTPVKRYSSGMNARLGFSIAAHLEPDVLIIDEVLAVGDAAFQQKAFARIKAMATGGAPVVLVSHQLDRIRELCTKAILLEKGAVRMAGTPTECIHEYLHGVSKDVVERTATSGIHLARISAPSGSSVHSGEDLTVVVEGTSELEELRPGWTPAVRVTNQRTGADVYSVSGFQRGISLPLRGEFAYQLTFQMNVPPGPYTVHAYIWQPDGDIHVVRGIKLGVEVLERRPFFGRAQLNVSWNVVRSAVPGFVARNDESSTDDRRAVIKATRRTNG